MTAVAELLNRDATEDELWRICEDPQRLERETSEALAKLVELCEFDTEEASRPELLEERQTYEQIEQAMNDLWVIRAGIQSAESALGDVGSGLDTLDKMNDKLEIFDRKYPRSRVAGELRKETQRARDAIMKRVEEAWNRAIVVEVGGVVVTNDNQDLPLADIFQVIESADQGKLYSRKEELLQKIEDVVVMPVLDLKVNASREGNRLVVEKSSSSPDLRQLQESLQCIVEYFQDVFQDTMAGSIAKRFTSMILTKLITKTLPALFPTDPTMLDKFEMQLYEFVAFEDVLYDANWSKGSELRDWARNFKTEWVKHRKLSYLDRIRTEIVSDLDVVQMSETPEVPKPAELQAPHEEEEVDDWNQEWDDDEEEDDDDNEAADEGDNWDWNDDEDDSNANRQPERSAFSQKGGGNTSVQAQAQVPVSAQAQAALSYRCTRNVDKLVTIAGAFARELPSETLNDLISMFRALTPIVYESQLLEFNDINQLIKQLPSLSEHEQSKLREHGQRCVSFVVESRLQDLSTIMQLADGFKECSPERNLRKCQTAISQSCELIQQAFSEWQEDVSFPVVCYMCGQLIESLVTSIIASIEAQEDISEMECNELTGLINQVCTLDRLFQDPTSSGDQSQTANLAAVHVPSWIKFQYFGEILQSKLVDILYLYNSNALMDYSATELIGIVKSMFAESEHRRNAINDILQGPSGVED